MGIQKVLDVIHHRPKSLIARGELTLDRGFVEKLLRWRSNNAIAGMAGETDLLLECCRVLKLDLVCLQSAGIEEQSSGLSAIRTVTHRISNEDLFVFWVVDGVFQSAMTRRGMIPMLKDIASSPDDVRDELRHLSDGVKTAMAQGVAAGAHGIIIADDIAYSRSTLMSPDFVKERLLPIWHKLVQHSRHLGVPVFFHSDGNLNAVLPCIVAAGFDGLQCIEPSAGMSFKEINKSYRQEFCLMGGIDPSLLSEKSDPCGTGIESRCARLRRAVDDFMVSANSDGGFIFGSCSGLHAGMSPELVDFMYHLTFKWDADFHADPS